MLILDSWVYYPNYKYILDYDLIIPSSASIIPYRETVDIFQLKHLYVTFDYTKYPKVKILGAIGNIIIEILGILIESFVYVALVKLFNPVTKTFDILVNVKVLQQIFANSKAQDFLEIYISDKEQLLLLLDIPFVSKLVKKCASSQEHLISDLSISDKIEELLLDYLIDNSEKYHDKPFFINVNMKSDVDIEYHCDVTINKFLNQHNGLLHNFIRTSDSMFKWKSEFEPILESLFTCLSQPIQRSLFDKGILLNKSIPAIIPINMLTNNSGFLDKQPLGYYFKSNTITLHFDSFSVFLPLIDITTELLRHPVSDFVLIFGSSNIKKPKLEFYNRNGMLQLTNDNYQKSISEIIKIVYSNSYCHNFKTKIINSIWKNAMEEISIGGIQIDAIASLLTFWY